MMVLYDTFFLIPPMFTFLLQDKDLSKENQSSEIDKVEKEDTATAEEVKLQHNGNCQPNEENLSVKTEEVQRTEWATGLTVERNTTGWFFPPSSLLHPLALLPAINQTC